MFAYWASHFGLAGFQIRQSLFINLWVFVIHNFSLWYWFSSKSRNFDLGGLFFCLGLRAINISMNTQAVQLQKRYHKTINGSFHGIWSLGGLIGILVATLMIYLEISMKTHLISVSLFALFTGVSAASFLLKNDRETGGNKFRFGKPDRFILYTGIVVFCAAVCEGGIYDWSSVYFKEVVQAELFTLSYLVFMVSMTLSRFYTDRLVDYFGMKKCSSSAH